ncbi:MAG TPA: NADP-dependent oxidoreductase [Spirochaetia bacterium]|nr:NADP-dependent oxidoreductase [Spirochaetia bacterium]
MSDSKMKAIQFKDYGGPEKLELVEVPRPTIGPNEVLIRMKAAGVNPADWKIREGYMKAWAPTPWVAGLDGAGVVAEVGAEVKDLRKGDAVFGPIVNSYAEYAKCQAAELTKLPKGLSFDGAATFPVGALTAWKSVEDAGVQVGQTVLVQGAAGGVGLFAAQLAKLKGAKVIGTASKDNLAFVRSLGVDQVIDYRAQRVGETLHDVDVVLDTVGGEAVNELWPVLKRGGVMVTIAAQLSEELAKKHGVRAVHSGRASATHLKAIADLYASGKIKTEIQTTFPLAQARAAQELCQTGHGRGRIVLHIED